MMPIDTARAVTDALRGTYEPFASTGSAATEYSAIIRRRKRFRGLLPVLPWDHAAGALAVTEAGGAACTSAGTRTAAVAKQVTIFAATRDLAESFAHGFA